MILFHQEKIYRSKKFEKKKKFTLIYYDKLLVENKKVILVISLDNNRWKFGNSIIVKNVGKFFVCITLLFYQVIPAF